MDIGKFIMEQALILVPVLYVIGMFLKNTPVVKDWTIPYIILGCGILGAVAIMGLSAAAVIQGILVAGTTVFTNQLIKQTTSKE
ncbi:phage holin family protein [Clostridium sp.]|uniref:phage holin family protein n=1 Tax=Clostridium sp. TaxID=1506 RepID=UPI002FCAD2EF